MDGSRTIAPSLPRHWPDACQTVSPCGKRGVTDSARKDVHSCGDTGPDGVSVPRNIWS